SRMKLKSDITTISESQFNAGIQQGMQQGMQQGKSVGFAEGSRQKAIETARLLKQLGDSVQKIVQVTGLTIKEVEKLNS
ncbi:MAG: Rpn family recombination-promoting nuclease/putative transposase, partial [Treponema sp.]